MKKLLVLLLVVMIALATFTPVAAGWKPEGRPDRGPIRMPSVTVTPIGLAPIFIPFIITSRQVIVTCSCGKYVIGLLENYSNACFDTKWIAYDTTDGGYYVLALYPFSPLRVSVIRY